MDKITFEEYCRYREKDILPLAALEPSREFGVMKFFICGSQDEYDKLSQRFVIYDECYSAIKDYPKQKDEIIKALRKYEQNGKPFTFSYTFWESSEEPPEDFKFVNIVYY